MKEESCYFYNREEAGALWESINYNAASSTPSETSELLTSIPKTKILDYGITRDFVSIAEKKTEPIALTSVEIIKDKKKLEISRVNALFLKNLLSEKTFFSKTKKIDLMKNAALATLDLIIKNVSTSTKKSKYSLIDNIRIKTILKFSAEDLNEDDLSEILLACYGEIDKEDIPEINENLDTHEILKILSEKSDIDRKINTNKINKLSSLISSNISKENSLKEKIEKKALKIVTIGLLYNDLKDINLKDEIEKEKLALISEKEKVEEIINSYKFLLQHILGMTKDLFSKTYHPSRYRTKYIQKIIRTTYSLMKSEVQQLSGNIKTEYEKILNYLKNIDDILIALALITSIYINNRLKVQKRSKNTLIKIANDFACISDIPEESNYLINTTPIDISSLTNFQCPINTDNIIVPHIPIELKLENISCEISQDEEISVEVKDSPELSTYAIIRNLRKNSLLVSKITKDTKLTQETKIATLDDHFLYSPVEGTVDKINNNEIIIKNISEPPEDYLTEQINLLNKKYEKYNNINAFIKNYYIKSLYPIMLSISIVDDASTYDESSGIEKEWKSLKKTFSGINEDYEKEIKKITGKDNVKQHAENETLYKIKEQLDEEQKKYYYHLSLYGEMAQKLAKKVKAKSNEYELFEYYALDLGAKFNGLENPSNLEKEFRDKINEIIRKRIIIDGYKKKKLERKINNLIKDLEKGISLGNWFNEGMLIFLTKRNINDVKKWLIGLGEKNKKLNEYEKTTLINRILFLFDLYLIYDNLTQKYNILKKETTDKKETIKEGNFLNEFFNNLWIERNTLILEIEEIQKIITDLSLIKTYSIIDYNGYKARLYTLSDETDCISLESNPYLTGKSTYEYKDIQYWLKYCAFATLASISNPVSGWSTGWIIPSPITFPVIYIPIKSIITNYGFVVIGISICGTWIFPWFLLSNLTLNHNTPFGDPTAILKREVNALRQKIGEQIKNLRKEFIKNKMNETKEKIDEIKINLKQKEEELKEHREQKPSKYLEISNFEDNLQGIPKNVNYIFELEKWEEEKLVLQELITTLKIKKWNLEKIHKILFESYELGKSISGGGEKLEKIENLINNQLDNLIALIDKINNILAPLPITMQPNTTNFGITLKNPNPIIKIEKELDDNINKGPLETIFNKFRLKNNNLISTNYSNTLNNSILNYEKYKNILALNMITLVKKDPFPSYELLKLSNIQWLKFLYTDFVTTGAKTYGYPGYHPLPI